MKSLKHSKLPRTPMRPLAVALLSTCLTIPGWAATLTVNDAGDTSDATPGDGICATAGGVCTLRAAIEEANALAGADNIHFNIGGGGAVTINKSVVNPDITVTSEVHIDGYTQPGATANTLTVGSNAILQVRYDGAAGSGNGLYFTAGSNNSTLKGLVLTRHTGAALVIDQATSIGITGNFIGTDAAGTDLHNGTGVFALDNADSIGIGGPLPADRNVIANNLSDGVAIGNSTSQHNLVRNNYIGTAPDGVSPRRNGRYGIRINSAFHTGIRDNVISPSTAAILVSNGGADQTTVTGNRIGVGADGITSIGGGATGDGVVITSGNSGAPNTVTVGGINPGEGNTIANLGGAAIRVDRINPAHSYPANVSIRGNSIHGNTGMGIDLSDSATGIGVGTANTSDPLDADGGANSFQNFPMPTLASTNGVQTSVNFTYGSYAAGGPFHIDAYASNTCDASGHGEGQVYLGSTTVFTDIGGNANGTLAGLPATTVGHYITLVATDQSLFSNSSEFSACLPISAGPVVAGGPQSVPTLGLLGQLLTVLGVAVAGLMSRRVRHKGIT